MVYQIIYPRAGGPFFSRGEIGIRKKFEGGLKILLMVMICPWGGDIFLVVTLGIKNGKGVKIFFSWSTY